MIFEQEISRAITGRDTNTSQELFIGRRHIR